MRLNYRKIFYHYQSSMRIRKYISPELRLEERHYSKVNDTEKILDFKDLIVVEYAAAS